MYSESEIRLALPKTALSVYAGLVLIALGWLALIFGTPLLADSHGVLALIFYRSFSAICHQMPERSFHLHGFPLAVCSRCTGIYAGFIVGLLIYPLVRNLRESEMPHRLWLILAALPVLADFGLDFVGLFDNTFVSRTATGALLGIVAAFFILPGCLATFGNLSTETFLWRKRISKSQP
ncbi:MAG: DUF2085 domain-containing protein [Acidobacteriota bacterium]|nr:DUF2085 domain-containing protein [Acidobacteriota bacterium]